MATAQRLARVTENRRQARQRREAPVAAVEAATAATAASAAAELQRRREEAVLPRVTALVSSAAKGVTQVATLTGIGVVALGATGVEKTLGFVEHTRAVRALRARLSPSELDAVRVGRVSLRAELGAPPGARYSSVAWSPEREAEAYRRVQAIADIIISSATLEFELGGQLADRQMLVPEMRGAAAVNSLGCQLDRGVAAGPTKLRAATGSGCATRLRSESGICTRRSRSRRCWYARVPT